MKSRFFDSFIAIWTALAAFFLLYPFLLEGSITIWHILFAFALALFYCAFSFVVPNIFGSILRLLVMLLLIVFSWVNFAHFRIFNSFITTGGGFGRLPNFSEIEILIDYWSSVPNVLYIVGLLLLLFLLVYEFKVKKKRTLYRSFIFVVSIIVFIGLFILPQYLKDSSWYSVSRYHSNLGPVGYVGAELFQNIELDNENVAHEDNILDILEKLKVASNYQAPEIPNFESLPNIIFYQLESVPQWAVNLEGGPMPFLKNLQQEAVSVDHFYGNDCHTVGAEFTTTCSSLTSSAEVVGNRLEPLKQECLPKTLSKDLGYETSVFHANTVGFWNRDVLMPQLGYQYLYFSPLFTPRLYDGLVIDDLLKKQVDAEQPQLSYFIGYTSHGPHTEDYIEKNKKESNIEIVPYDGELPSFVQSIPAPEEELRNYFGFLTSVDQAIEKMFADLENSGELDNTIVVIYGDHRYYNFQNDDAQHYQLYNELPFVLYVPGMKNEHLAITASHIDIAPTLLDVLGVHYNPKQYMGKSLFSKQPHNYAFGKCGQEVFYFTNDTAIRGNQSTGSYLGQSTKDNQVKEIAQETLGLLSQAADISDDLWAYQEDFILPDKTLVIDEVGDLYIIDEGNRRHIKSEKVFLDMGYNWKDVHRFSSEELKMYLLADPVEFVEPHLINNGYKVEAGSSILRPENNYPYRYHVAHALGSADGVTGCNCLEAFHESYAKAFRIFEMDLAMTKDKKIVIFHESPGMKASEIDHQEFMTLRYADTLTMIDIETIFSLMQEYPDAYFITDAKENFTEIHQELVKLAKEKYPEALDRIIPQIYRPADLEILQSLYDFPDIIYTLYMTEPDDQIVLGFLKNQDSITAITERDGRYNDDFAQRLRDMNVSLYVHTVNDKDRISEMLDKDVGVYTDGL